MASIARAQANIASSRRLLEKLGKQPRPEQRAQIEELSEDMRTYQLLLGSWVFGPYPSSSA